MVKVGERDVLNSGSVISEAGLPVLVPVDDLKITFEFYNVEGGETKIQLKGGGEKSLTIELTNFNNALGVAYDQSIGEVDGRRLTMALLVHTLGQERKTYLLHYTFSVGDLVNVKN